MKNFIFDGKHYYFFRSLNDENVQDLKKGIKNIRTDCIRYYEENKKWGKYSTKDKLTIEELYDHVKPGFRRDTNCISVTPSVEVVLSYHTNNEIYRIIKVSKEQLENKKIFNAGICFYEYIEKRIQQITKTIKNNDLINILKNIDHSKEIEEVKSILSLYDDKINLDNIAKKEFLNNEEILNISKINAKYKILDNLNLIKYILKDVKNSDYFQAIENAFSSVEFIHYGDILEVETKECSKEDLLKLNKKSK